METVAESGDETDSTRATFEEFFESFWPRAVGLAALLVGDPLLAAELTQDVFGQVFQRWTTIENPDLYLKAAIRNEVRARHRSVIRRRLVEPDQVVATVSSDRDQQLVDGIDVRRALAVLSADHYEVVVLRYYGELSDTEISAALGVRLGTVKSRLRRALTHLHRELE